MVMVAKPVIPQTRVHFRGLRAPTIRPSVGATVAIPGGDHDWGPLYTELAKPEVISSFAQWTERYGDSDTELRTAVAGAFAGQNLSGAGGAGGVIPVRMGTGAARASITLQNTAAANAVELTAQWTGVRGNDYDLVIDADPADANRDRVRIRFRGAVIETYTYARADLAAFVAAVNARKMGNVTAELLADGVGLALTAGSSLVGGTNGAVPNGADHLAAQDALAFQPFTILAPANLTDPAIRASYLAWIRAQEDDGRPVVMVEGGAAGETIDDAIARTVATADPHVVNFGVGTYHDDLLDKDLSTAQLAPRMAGILAAKGEDKALTGAEVGGLHIVGATGISAEDAQLGVQRGVTLLIRTDSDEADLRVAKGLTTFTDDADENRPRYIFEEPRFIRIMDLFVRNLKRWGDKNIIGNVPVNDDTRDAVRAEGSRLMGDLLARGLILTKAQGAEGDPFFTVPVTTDDTIPFSFGWQFAQTANYLLGDGTVR
jgi:hypothetical protein